jgi:hypothetical protein
MIGDGLALPHTFAGKGVFEAVGLSKGSVLTAFTFDVARNGMSFENCSDARILLGHVGNQSHGVIRVEGTEGDRDGFFGVQTGHTRYRIEDNQSLVGSECYQEQMGGQARKIGPFAYLAGLAALPAGRVTISSPKISGTNWHARYGLSKYPPFDTFYTVDNYRGRLSCVASFFFNGFWVKEQPPKKAFRYQCSGEAPLDILLLANDYQRVQPSIEGGTNVTRNLLGNWLGALRNESRPIPDALSSNGMQLAACALDDFRELGALDLLLNYPDLGVWERRQSRPDAQKDALPIKTSTSATTGNR